MGNFSAEVIHNDEINIIVEVRFNEAMVTNL
jgi:hypothetical protein